MNAAAKLRTPLWIFAIYVLIVGFLELFPSLSVPVFGRPITDPAIESAYGVVLLTLGLVALLAARNPQKYAELSWIFIFGLLLGVVDYAYFWAKGAFDARTILPPIVINLVLAIWIWFGRAQRNGSP